LLEQAQLDLDGETEIYLPGFHPISFELTENGIAEALYDEIEITANTFPGVYYVTADTYSRNESTGEDEFFQLIIPKVKILSETNTLTMEAEGDPTVFSMSLKALQAKNQPLMRLVKYAAETKTLTEQIVTVEMTTNTGSIGQSAGADSDWVVYPFSCEGTLPDAPEGASNLEISFLDCTVTPKFSTTSEPVVTLDGKTVKVNGTGMDANRLLSITVRYQYKYFI
jgi:hypothetical protein